MTLGTTALFLTPALIWGSTWLAITWRLGVVAPQVCVTYRFAVASLVLAVGCVAARRSLRFAARDHACLAGVGLLMICVNYILIYLAERLVTSGLVAVVYSTIVFMTPIAILLSTLFEGYRWTWIAVLGVVLAVLGNALALRTTTSAAAARAGLPAPE